MHNIYSVAKRDYTIYTLAAIINPRRACAARVTVVVLCVCLFVCLSIDIIPYGTGLEAHHVISFNLYICARRTPRLSERVKFRAETREKRETVLLVLLVLLVYWPYYHKW